MKHIRVFLSENFLFLEVKIVVYLNRRVFVLFAFVHTNPVPTNESTLYGEKLIFLGPKSFLTKYTLF